MLKRILQIFLCLAGFIILVFFSMVLYFRIDPDVPHGGDPLEDRRGLLRNVPAPVLRDIAQNIHFRGALVVEAVQNNQHDLWLVETSRFGSVTRRLTASLANETDPVWSPDGKWIAYLSDASGPGGIQGKLEVFVRHMTDGNTFQITNSPEIDWQGPLDWEFDKHGIKLDGSWNSWIVLTGAAQLATGGITSGSSVYYLPVSGTDRKPKLVANTQGAAGLVRTGEGILFGTRDGRLFFTIDGAEKYDYEDFSKLDEPGAGVVTKDQSARGLEIVPGSFDWISPSGRQMIYLTQGEPPDGEVGFEIGLATITSSNSDSNNSNPYMYDTIQTEPRLSGRVGTIRKIISVVSSKFLALQDGELDGTGQTGCARLHFYNLADTPINQHRPALFSDLCLDDLPDGFHPQSELKEENIKHQYEAVWRVFSGRPPGEKKSSLYATLVFKNQAYLNLSQVRHISAQITGEIVPGSVRIRPYVNYSQPYKDDLSHLIDPLPAP